MEVLDAGTLVDRFSPWGDYFAEDESAAAQARAEWRGNAQRVAEAVGCWAEALQPYYRYVGDQSLGKVADSDAFPLEDFWVFTDIWRRFGPQYPPNPDVFAARLRVAKRFGSKLPTWEGEPLAAEPA